MPKIYGYGGLPGGPLSGGSVPVPTTPVIHRGRPAPRDSGFKMLNSEEFTQEQVAAALAPPRGRSPRRSRARGGDHAGQRAGSLTKADVKRIVKLYVDERMTTRQVHEATGFSQTTIQKYLHLAGVQVRPPHLSRRRGPEPPPKVCSNKDCGKTFYRPEGMRLDAWKRRVCCSRECGVLVANLGRAAARAERKLAA